MTISIDKNTIKILNADKVEKVLVVGYEDISKHGFQVVDHIVDQVILEIKNGEDVYVSGDTLEAKMVARKIEDKIKREVMFISDYKNEY